MKALLIGANGQLGTDLERELSSKEHTVVACRRADLDVTNNAAAEKVISTVCPDVVINAAAFHKVEECEQKASMAFEVNAIAPMHLARICARLGLELVHFSTDYVFNGAQQTPYEEGDLPAPLNVYGTSKMAGERLIAANMDRYFIVRTCGLYGVAGSSGKGGNFVETMLRKAREGGPIRVVNDQVLTPTSTEDLAKILIRLITTKAYGLYHASCEGWCSWFEFAHKIFEIAGLSADLHPVATHEFASPVKRPPYSVMSKRRLRALGLHMPPWEASLATYLNVRTAKEKPC